ncbi:hypothetical protein BP00DRAFT_209454 [Aspergillus indologenus CBS 114.80]|uniref:Uncharacterized protein n=1 Tax=Aspergillus indologenus CBS 114.80 TaxID=1450541 RepID=A0A2V5J0D4_9EURO|nr:hypothetical protein BP00DRAFT_209454 [Aspergillus indologenus CBS 114.80]
MLVPLLVLCLATHSPRHFECQIHHHHHHHHHHHDTPNISYITKSEAQTGRLRGTDLSISELSWNHAYITLLTCYFFFFQFSWSGWGFLIDWLDELDGWRKVDHRGCGWRLRRCCNYCCFLVGRPFDSTGPD